MNTSVVVILTVVAFLAGIVISWFVTKTHWAGKLAIPTDGYIVVADGSASGQIQTVEAGQAVQSHIASSPAAWDSYPEIAGAGA